MTMNIHEPAIQSWYAQIDQDTRDWLSMALFYRELETIRRDAPLLNPRTYPVATLRLYDRDMDYQPQLNVSLRGGSMPSNVSPRVLWRNSNPNDTNFPRFLQRILAKAATVQVIDDDGDDAGSGPTVTSQPPGPLTPMRPEIQNIRERIGYTKPFEQQFPQEVLAAKTDTFLDQDTMFQEPDWKDYLPQRTRNPLLYKGFPMVEQVVFVKHPNYWDGDVGKDIESGQCYWLAVALLLYGNASAWLRVKAEHLSYLENVLRKPDHPRHAFYARENQAYTHTKATGPGGRTWTGSVNLWEKLLIPGCWANEDLCHLTADVYSVFLVLYKYDADKDNPKWMSKVYDLKTYGSYNTRHIFMCYFRESHFQPMVPNDFYAYEFKVPRLTLSNTKDYRLVTRERRRLIRDGPGHHWRGEIKTIAAPLTRPSFEPEHLARAVGYYGTDGKLQPNLSTPEPARRTGTQRPTSDPTPSMNRANAAVCQRVDTVSPNSAALQQRTNNTNIPTTHPSRQQATTTTTVITSSPSKSDNKRTISPVYSSPDSSPKRQRIRNTPPPHTRPPTSPSVPSKSPQHTPKPPAAVPQTPHRRTPTPGPRTRNPVSAPASFSYPQLEPSPKPSKPSPQPRLAHTTQQTPPVLPPNTRFRPATHALLASKIRLHRLRKWYVDLALAAPHEVAGWKKKDFVNELLRVRLEVLMRWAGGGLGWVPVSVEEEEGGVVAVRRPVWVVVGGDDGEGEEDEDEVDLV